MEPAAIEFLEPRIAPAKISISYTDVDGDLVKITASRAGTVVPELSADDLVFTDGNPDGQLLSLTITDFSFIDASITFTVKKKPGGDGFAHVGLIDATGIDLNKVTVKGDLGRILVGDATIANDPALNLLAVRSMGTLGLATQGGTGNLESVIQGKLGALKVRKSILDAVVRTTGSPVATGGIGPVFIGGDLLVSEGSSGGKIISDEAIGNVRVLGNVGGEIRADGAIGNVRVNGELEGKITSNGAMGDAKIGGGLGGALSSGGAMGDVRIGGDVEGSIANGAGIASIRIKGDLRGGESAATGTIASNQIIGRIWIGGDVTAGGVFQTGEIRAGQLIDRVEIKGDLTGRIDCAFGSIGLVKIGGDVVGSKTATGVIYASHAAVIIGGDLMGGSIGGSDNLLDSGAIIGGDFRSITIKGSIIAGTNQSTGSMMRSAGIFAGIDIGTLKVSGSLLGNETAAVLITARGQETKPTTGFDVAIGKLSVGGDVKFARILAGFGELENPVNADASIGKVTVGKRWEASSLVAGAQDDGVIGFGTGDALQTVGDTALIARIESIIIRRGVAGTTALGDDRFGFVSQQIDKLKIGSTQIALTAGPSNDDLAIPSTDDVRVLEVL